MQVFQEIHRVFAKEEALVRDHALEVLRSLLVRTCTLYGLREVSYHMIKFN